MPSLDEYITINGVDLALDGAWELMDPTPLLAEGPARGANRVIPGQDGAVYRTKKRDVWRDVLPMDVFGDKDFAGVAHSNYRDGMRDNIEYLCANLLATNVGAVTLTYTFPDAATRTGACEVREIRASSRSQIGNWTICALDIVLLDGRLTEPAAPV